MGIRADISECMQGVCISENWGIGREVEEREKDHACLLIVIFIH